MSRNMTGLRTAVLIAVLAYLVRSNRGDLAAVIAGYIAFRVWLQRRHSKHPSPTFDQHAWRALFLGNSSELEAAIEDLRSFPDSDLRASSLLLLDWGIATGSIDEESGMSRIDERLSEAYPDRRPGLLAFLGRPQEAADAMAPLATPDSPGYIADRMRWLLRARQVEAANRLLAAFPETFGPDYAVRATHQVPRDMVVRFRESVDRIIGPRSEAATTLDVRLGSPVAVGEWRDRSASYWYRWRQVLAGDHHAAQELRQSMRPLRRPDIIEAIYTSLEQLGFHHAVAALGPPRWDGPADELINMATSAYARSLIAVGRVNEGVAQLFDLDAESVAGALEDPSRRKAVREADRFPALVDHITNG